jgi:hypothetical protein
MGKELYPQEQSSRGGADHLPPFSAEGRNEWSYTSTLLYAVMASSGTTLPFNICLKLRLFWYWILYVFY